jgi:hypothetical protein
MTEDATVLELPPADSLRELLQFEKTRYLQSRKEQGGTAEGFRQRVRRQYSRHPDKFDALVLDALMEAATKNWEAQPRKHGPDLFSISSDTVPEFLTRPALFVTGEDIETEAESRFEKVHQKYATVNDYREDALIKMRKAAQSSAAAEKQMQAVDEALRRAKGKGSTPLQDIADE